MISSCPVVIQEKITREINIPVAERKVTGNIGYRPNKIIEITSGRIPSDILKSVLNRLKCSWAQIMQAVLISIVCLSLEKVLFDIKLQVPF